MKVKNNKTSLRCGHWGVNETHSLPRRPALNTKENKFVPLPNDKLSHNLQSCLSTSKMDMLNLKILKVDCTFWYFITAPVKLSQELEMTDKPDFPIFLLVSMHKYIWLKSNIALAGVAWWIERQPENQRVAGWIPSQGTCLGCRSGSQWEVLHERQPHINISLPPFPSL